MRGLVVLTILAGCNWAFGLDDTNTLTPDAPTDAPGCADNSFSSAVVLPGDFNEGSVNYDPSLAAPLELWFTRPGSNFDIYKASRLTPQSDFASAVIVADLATSADEEFPSFDKDGLDLVFARDDRISETTRPSVDAPFALAAEIPELVGILARHGLDLSFDGLTIYYSDSDSDLYSVTRPRRDLPFGAPVGPLASDVRWPGVSPDELELYFEPGSMPYTIYKMTRASTDMPFNSRTPVMTGGDPDILPDAMTLLIHDGGVIKRSTRTCM